MSQAQWLMRRVLGALRHHLSDTSFSIMTFTPLFSAALGAGPPRFQLLSCAPSPDFWRQLMSQISVLTPPPRGGKPLLPDKQLGFTIFIISSWPQSLIPAVGEMPSQVPQMTEMNEIPPSSPQQWPWQTRTTAGSR